MYGKQQMNSKKNFGPFNFLLRPPHHWNTIIISQPEASWIAMNERRDEGQERILLLVLALLGLLVVLKTVLPLMHR
jgi:hypothetical protein